MRRRRGRATANETSSVRRFVMDRGESCVRVMVRVGGGACCALREKEEKTPRCLKTARGGAAPSRLTPPSFVASSHCPPRRRRACARPPARSWGARGDAIGSVGRATVVARALESRTRGGGGGVSRASRCARVRSMVLGLGSGTAAPAPVLKTVQGEGDSGFWKLMIRLRRGRCCLRCARPEARFSKTSTLRCHHDEKSRTTTPRRPTSVASRAGPV